MAKTKTLTPADTLKEICPLFEAIGVTSITAEYEGSGDSGDFNFVQFRFDDPIARADQAVSMGTTSQSKRVLNEHMFKMRYVKDPKVEPTSLITEKAYERFRDAFFDLLPGGWEINDGSYGEITIDTATRKVRMVHNERVNDVNTSESEW
jgi:hypothetical protein